MVDKNRAIDIMQDCFVDGIPLYNFQDYNKLLEYKYNKNNKYKEYVKLSLIIRFNMFSGIRFIKIMLRKIYLAK